MTLFTIQEYIDLVIMIVAIGFIFAKIFKKQPVIRGDYDPVKQYSKSKTDNFLEDLKWGIIVAGPAIVLHELAHKFVAMSFGATATLHAPYTMYAIVILLIMLKSPIIFFVGGYVSHTALPALQSAMVSFAGPATNLILWGVFHYLSTTQKGKKKIEMYLMMKKINMFLFIFNMIPLPGFDGFHVISSLFKYFGGFF